MSDAMQAYAQWADIGEAERTTDFKSYVHNVAEARYVIRRVLRIIDDQAQRHGLHPLLHQALLQIYGAGGDAALPVSGLASRLDIAAAFSSRLVKQLEERHLVERRPSEHDRRITLVVATAEGARLLQSIDESVHHEVAHFQHSVSEDQCIAALSIFAFYVGLRPDSPIAAAIRVNRTGTSPRS